jgi:hypothetical protein
MSFFIKAPFFLDECFKFSKYYQFKDSQTLAYFLNFVNQTNKKRQNWRFLLFYD